MRETKRHRRRNQELELECYVISMIAELRFVFGENETVRDLRERELVIYERLRASPSSHKMFIYDRIRSFRILT